MAKVLLEKVNLHNPPMENQIDMKQESELECNNNPCEGKANGTKCITQNGHEGRCFNGECHRV